MKHKLREAPIKWKLLAAFAGFTLAMLALLWTFQVVLLDQFYKGIKTRDITSAAQVLMEHANDEDLDSLAQSLAAQYELCVMVQNTQGNVLVSADTLPDCRIHKMNNLQLFQLYQMAVANGGRYVERITKDPAVVLIHGMEMQILQPRYNSEKESMILVQILDSPEGEEGDRILLLNSVLSPVNATVQTLRIQLLLVTFLMIGVSLVLSLILSRRLARPIAKVNESAKLLAGGNYDTRFDGGGYREIAELNETLNHMAEELSKVEGLRKELLANISHDLRTPLTMITGYAEMMRDLPGEGTPENIQVIIDEASRLTRLVNDLLDLSKLQAGVQELTVERLNLTEMIQSILKRYAKLTEQDGYQIEVALAENVWVDADESKLSQVIYNLINNAINYTGPDNRIMVRLTCREDWARVEIQDTGIGIPSDQLHYVWDRYYKLDRTHKRAAVGTGLGLSIVKNVLEMHKARFGADSVVGRGSTFWFELPLSETE